MTNRLDRAALARFIDHTLLTPEATRAEIDNLIAEGQRLGVYGVCLPPSFLPVEAPGLHVVTVCGFPSGQHRTTIKVAEAARAVADGAEEIDMVIDIGAAKERNWELVRADIAAVRAATEGRVLKVIIEAAALSDHEIVESCRIAANVGAEFVKTSTGFHPAGGASVRDVSIMADTVGGRCGVKASGGIRTLGDAYMMIEAGATRLGMSATASILAEMTV